MKYLTMMLCIAALSGCGFLGGGEQGDLKSPCAGAKGSPCDDQKRNVNAWWLA